MEHPIPAALLGVLSVSVPSPRPEPHSISVHCSQYGQTDGSGRPRTHEIFLSDVELLPALGQPQLLLLVELQRTLIASIVLDQAARAHLSHLLSLEVVACLCEALHCEGRADDDEHERNAKKSWIFAEGAVDWARVQRMRGKRRHEFRNMMYFRRETAIAFARQSQCDLVSVTCRPSSKVRSRSGTYSTRLLSFFVSSSQHSGVNPHPLYSDSRYSLSLRELTAILGVKQPWTPSKDHTKTTNYTGSTSILLSRLPLVYAS